jgi:uncharacterized protein
VADLQVLLQVQALDTTADQLRHRRAALPELETVSRRRAELEDLRNALQQAETSRTQADQQREELEAEVSQADGRIAEIEKRMFAGSAGPRELESMSTEVAHLKDRRSGLEDQALEAMDVSEQCDSRCSQLQASASEIEEHLQAALAELARAEKDIDEELAGVTGQRAEAAKAVDPPLLEAYDKLRSKLGGVGAARLEGDRCTGCHLSLPSAELERLRAQPAEAVLHCDNCQRILVR